MKKLMAIVLLGAATISTSAFGFWGGSGCCNDSYEESCEETTYEYEDCGCSSCGW